MATADRNMANAEAHSLVLTVQELLGLFYSPQTNNEEKKNIELRLAELQNTSFNWHICMAYMNEIDDSYLWFFVASTVERTVNIKWNELSAIDQAQLDGRMQHLFLNYPPDLPALQRDKAARIMAQIARQQYDTSEDYYDTFVRSALQLLKHKFFLGMALLAAIGDTVTSVEHTQATHFVSVVSRTIPHIMMALNTFCNMFVLWGHDRNIPTVYENMSDEMRNRQCTQLLNVIQQYFSWMKLDQVEGTLVRDLSYIACTWVTLRDGAIGALGALTELLYRNESLRYDAGHELTTAVYRVLKQEGLQRSDELYQEKICDFVRQYIKRGFPCTTVDDRSCILLKLLEVTKNTKSPHTLMELVNIWTLVCGSRYTDDPDNEATLYTTEVSTGSTHELVLFLMNTLFFRTYPELSQLDNDDLDENLETELQRYAHQNIDLICQLVRFLDQQTLQDCMLALLETNPHSPYVEGHRFILGMLEIVQGKPEILQRYEDERMVQICMADYITACDLTHELMTVLYGKYPAIDHAVQRITINQIQMFAALADVLGQFLTTFITATPFKTYILPALSRFIMQINVSLQLGGTSTQLNDAQGGGVRKLCDLISHDHKMLLFTQLPTFILQETSADRQRWSHTVLATIKLLQVCITEKMLGPSTCAILYDLIKCNVFSSKLMHLQTEARCAAYRTVFNCIMLLCDEPIVNTTGMIPSLLLEHYISFLAGTMEEFVPEMWTHMPLEQLVGLLETITDELHSLNVIMAHYESSSFTMRSRLVGATYRMIEQVIVTFRNTLAMEVWSANNATSTRLLEVLLEFCSCTVNILQVRQDLPTLKNIVLLLKDLFMMEERICTHRLRSALTLLNTFRKLVMDSHNRVLVPDIVHIVIDVMLPMVACEERYTEADETLRYEDVLNRVYEVLHDVLQHRWQWFVDTNPAARMEPEARTIIQPETFLAIMNVYGYALRSNTGYPSVVGTVLTSLDMLNSRRNLYRLLLYSEQLLDQFMKSLLQLAVSSVASIHMEQLITVLYGMADIDPNRLKVAICDLGMTHDLNTFHILQSARDLPSFRMVLLKIINDAKAQERVSSDLRDS